MSESMPLSWLGRFLMAAVACLNVLWCILVQFRRVSVLVLPEPNLSSKRLGEASGVVGASEKSFLGGVDRGSGWVDQGSAWVPRSGGAWRA